MAGPNRSRSGDKAVAYLAISFVLAAGIGFGSLAIVIFSEHAWRDFWMLAGGLAGVLLLYWLLRDSKDGMSPADVYRAVFGPRKKKNKVQIKIKRVKGRRAQQDPEGPPTVERVRELAAGSNAWVPSERPHSSENERD